MKVDEKDFLKTGKYNVNNQYLKAALAVTNIL